LLELEHMLSAVEFDVGPCRVDASANQPIRG
jgi:hypothetical protein